MNMRITSSTNQEIILEPDLVFSGDASREMWNEINKAKTVTELRWALYGVCCKLQEFESKVNAALDKQNTK